MKKLKSATYRVSRKRASLGATQVTTMRLNCLLLRDLTLAARNNEISRTQLVDRILRRWLSETEGTKRKIADESLFA